MKNLLNYLWVVIAGFAVWLVYKLFVSKDEEDKPLDVTSSSTGLSFSDIDIYNKVSANLSDGGNPYSWSNVFIPCLGVEYGKSAVKLGELLAKVQDKPLFAKVWAKKHNSVLPSSIVDSYGEKVYTLVAMNVPNFVEFII